MISLTISSAKASKRVCSSVAIAKEIAKKATKTSARIIFLDIV